MFCIYANKWCQIRFISLELTAIIKLAAQTSCGHVMQAQRCIIRFLTRRPCASRTSFCHQSQPTRRHFDSVTSVSELYLRLRRCALKGETKNARKTAEYLVRTRNEKPNLHIYSALILATSSREHGSAADLAALLKEMADAGLELDNDTCHEALKVCSLYFKNELMNLAIADMCSRC